MRDVTDMVPDVLESDRCCGNKSGEAEGAQVRAGGRADVPCDQRPEQSEGAAAALVETAFQTEAMVSAKALRSGTIQRLCSCIPVSKGGRSCWSSSPGGTGA